MLAHPTYVSDLDGLLPDLIDAGLIGMEVYYKDYTEDIIENLAGIASRNNLIMTGGTDYHAFGDDSEVMLGRHWLRKIPCGNYMQWQTGIAWT